MLAGIEGGGPYFLRQCTGRGNNGFRCRCYTVTYVAREHELPSPLPQAHGSLFHRARADVISERSSNCLKSSVMKRLRKVIKVMVLDPKFTTHVVLKGN